MGCNSAVSCCFCSAEFFRPTKDGRREQLQRAIAADRLCRRTRLRGCSRRFPTSAPPMLHGHGFRFPAVAPTAPASPEQFQHEMACQSFRHKGNSLQTTRWSSQITRRPLSACKADGAWPQAESIGAHKKISIPQEIRTYAGSVPRTSLV